MNEHTAFCQVCINEGASQEEARFPLEDLFGHLRGAHGIDAEPETWPDGDVVIVDNTLQAVDFEDER